MYLLGAVAVRTLAGGENTHGVFCACERSEILKDLKDLKVLIL